MAHAIILGAVVAAAWLLLSGLFDPLILGLGLASSVIVTLIALRMEVVDHESVPVHVNRRIFGYWAWLLARIVVANLAVARTILDPRLPISPQLFRVRASQPTDLGQVVFANSITLTPGTVATRIEGGEVEVHSLTRASAEALRTGEMDRRVTALEGRA